MSRSQRPKEYFSRPTGRRHARALDNLGQDVPDLPSLRSCAWSAVPHASHAPRVSRDGRRQLQVCLCLRAHCSRLRRLHSPRAQPPLTQPPAYRIEYVLRVSVVRYVRPGGARPTLRQARHYVLFLVAPKHAVDLQGGAGSRVCGHTAQAAAHGRQRHAPEAASGRLRPLGLGPARRPTRSCPKWSRECNHGALSDGYC
jgi:hypothetical protein